VRASKNPKHAGSLSCSSIPLKCFVFECVCPCVVRLGVGGGDEEKKRRTLNAVDDDGEQNLLDAVVEYGARKNDEREFVLQQCSEHRCEGILRRSLSL
jgi:hypothetical protein